MDQQNDREEPQPLRRLLYNPRVVNRLRQATQDREFRRELLLSPKNQLMTTQLQQPQLRRDWIEKCRNCRGTEQSDIAASLYDNTELFCTQFVDMLLMKYEGDGLKAFLKVEYHRYQLSRTIKSLLVHPVCLDVLRAFRDQSVLTVVFVVEPSECDVNRVVMEFLLMLVGVQNFGWNSIKARSTSVVALDKNVAVEMLNAENANNEIIFIPVTINFDKIDCRIFHDNLGTVRLNLIEPYAKCDMMKNLPSEQKSSAIIDHLKHDIMMKMPIMCTNVLAFLLVTRFRADGGTLESVCRAFDEIRHRHRHSIEFAFVGDTREVLTCAMETLKELIIVRDDNVKASHDDEKIRALSMYSKPLARHFALESILIASAEYLDDKCGEAYDVADAETRYTIDREHLVNMAELLVERFNDEFQLVAPCVDAKDAVEKAVEEMFRDDFFRTSATDEAEELDPDEIRARRMYANMHIEDSDSEDDYGREQPKVGYYEMRLNYEEKRDDIAKLRQILPDVKSQFVRCGMLPIVLIVAETVMIGVVDSNEDDRLTMDEQIDEIVKNSADLAEILNYEYFLKIDPRKLVDEAESSLAKCVIQNYITKDEDAVLVKLNDDKFAEIEKLKNEILPSLDAYYTVCLELKTLAKDGTNRFDTERFIDDCIEHLSHDIESGTAKFRKSLSRVTMKNALKYFERTNAIRQLAKKQKEIELIADAQNFIELAQFIVDFLPAAEQTE